MIGRSVYLLFVLVATTAIANAAPAESNEVLSIGRSSSGPHDLIVGHRTPTDQLIIRSSATAIVPEDDKTLPSDPSGFVLITSTLHTINDMKITQVKALDQLVTGNGAFATLVSGGPGATYVTLQFKSQHSINFIVEVYGE